MTLRGGARAATLVLTLLSANAPQVHARSGNQFVLREAAPDVYVHEGKQVATDAPGHDDIANLSFVVGSRCVAVIDTGGSVQIGRAFLAALRTRTHVPICYVINTHVHFDHVLGNAAFKPVGASFIGHAALRAAMLRSRQFFVDHYGSDLDAPASPDQVIAPDRLVEKELTLDLGGRALLLKAWPEAHTDCDLTVYDERTGTLWTGDLLFRERLPVLDGSVAGWIQAIDTLALLRPQLVVPGHGHITHDLKTALDAERRYLSALAEGARAALDAGRSMQEAMTQVAAGEASLWPLWDGVNAHNVARVYQELEWK